jgi:molybdopterin-guanine dinucleotide biosynthesis protein A
MASEIERNVTLVILAGGEGSRLGKPKGLLSIGGRPILEHILENARWEGPTLLVTSPGRQSPPEAERFDAEVVDPVAGLGPIRGVLTALEHSTTDEIVVSAVDMPAMGAEQYRWMAEQLHLRASAIAILLGRIQNETEIVEPLPAGFRKSARELLEKRIAEKKRSLRGLNGSADVQIVSAPPHWDSRIWENLNYPEDLARWNRI